MKISASEINKSMLKTPCCARHKASVTKIFNGVKTHSIWICFWTSISKTCASLRNNMLTDREKCMSAYTSGQMIATTPLQNLRSAPSQKVSSRQSVNLKVHRTSSRIWRYLQSTQAYRINHCRRLAYLPSSKAE
jgi:hypothetical protein